MSTINSKKRQLHRRLERAKSTLDQAIKNILDINKAKKASKKVPPENVKQVREELKLLNKIADQQAQLVKVYENQLHNY